MLEDKPTAGEPTDTPPASPAPPVVANPFAEPEATPDDEEAVRRQSRRAIAIFGLVTGAVMALLVLACIGLLFAAQNSG